MRKVMRRKPGPKSKTQRKILTRAGTLGETSCGSESDAEENDIPSIRVDASEFRTPERDDQLTDYGLELTRTCTRRTSTRNSLAKSQNARSTVRNESPPESSRQAANRATTTTRQRKQTHPARLEKRFWKEVQQLQTREYLIPLLPFSRLVREVIAGTSTEVSQITRPALEALQISSEMYITQRLQDAYMLTLHRNRVTLSVKDLKLIKFLKSNMY